MTDRNGHILQPGARVAFQVNPRLPWRTGTVCADGRHVRDDYDGSESLPWPAYTRHITR